MKSDIESEFPVASVIKESELKRPESSAERFYNSRLASPIYIIEENGVRKCLEQRYGIAKALIEFGRGGFAATDQLHKFRNNIINSKNEKELINCMNELDIYIQYKLCESKKEECVIV